MSRGRARLRIGTRGSRLAMWQAEHVAGLLREAHPDLEVTIETIRTTGDRILDAPLARIGGKGLFTKEIEETLLDGRVDVAVHSLKDLPTALPAGLGLGAVLSRHDPSDVLISAGGRGLGSLPDGARIGTSSLRRRAQLLHARPGLEIVDVRGNVPTRLEKAASGEVDAVVLARAGVERLGLGDRITEVLSDETILPAPGQGAVGVEVREGDWPTLGRLRGLEDGATRAATDAERAFLEALGGGCQVPIAALARPEPDEPGWLRLEGMVADPAGVRMLRGSRAAAIGEAHAMGRALAIELIGRGAAEILAELAPPPGGPGEEA
jgi:hydroxymethylbilane synthase